MPRSLRIVLTGPESTGKTSLAEQLAAHLKVPWTPEAAREFATWSNVPLSADTVDPIARLSMGLEDAVLVKSPPLIVRDTDLLSTVVYARHYYGHVAKWITDEARTRLADLYLLCLPDLPWVADGVRDRPDAREQLLGDFRGVLREFTANVAEVSGTGPARFAMASRAAASLRRAAE